MRTIVFGADSLIGSALCDRLKSRGDVVFGTTRKNDHAARSNTIFLDLADLDQLPPFPDVDAVVICAAVSRFADCRRAPEIARRVNVAAPITLGRIFIGRGARVVLLSTNAVFDGRSPCVLADQRRSPRSMYGRFKADAEIGVLSLGQKASVLRLTKVLTPRFALFNEWITTLTAGGRVRAFTDHGISPIMLRDVIDAIIGILDHDEGGIFQVSGASDICYADAALQLAHYYGLPTESVIPVEAAEAGLPIEEISTFTSLDTTRLSDMMGFLPPKPITVLDDIFCQTPLDRARH